MFVSSVTMDIKRDQLYSAFLPYAKFGNLRPEHVLIVAPRDRASLTTHAFVHFDTQEEAGDAIAALQCSQLGNTRLRLDFGDPG